MKVSAIPSPPTLHFIDQKIEQNHRVFSTESHLPSASALSDSRAAEKPDDVLENTDDTAFSSCETPDPVQDRIFALFANIISKNERHPNFLIQVLEMLEKVDSDLARYAIAFLLLTIGKAAYHLRH